ncbi:N-acetylglucosamine-6-phosphate deacetylase [Arsenicicoccus sp. oral taxon 190]|uniref:N-acetylglucosamine-6-phosphate deacetylase n=1 Tax=Arsenicicoccus sp. oral taxon 190 TaxID=1658671 RepID=UPI00067A222E|nr:N-acetylglucosamine-6-phosphate deacetylase [Arsenicicoccus sp. oral taxon 190]AKT50434.1 N-acetylglucosamine-6-phosphate deacetylase [Arsenicicoccus sp. oral taxon 190]
MILTASRLLHPDGHLTGPGWVRVEGDTLVEVGEGTAPAAAEPPVDLGAVTLAPGLVDQHSHGGGGAAFTDGTVAAARRVVATHAEHGTTTMMASLVTDTIDQLGHLVGVLAPLVASGELVGIHLEGPWLSRCHRGAHDPDKLVPPTREDLDRLLGGHPGAVRMVTLAPELPGGIEAVRTTVAHGALAAIGHSDATLEVAAEAVDAGATVATHLFNAMRPLHHREPGIVGATLTDPRVMLEIICDGIHVHPAVVGHVAASCPERLVLVTDAMAAAGAPDGRYLLGPLDVDVVDGVARLVAGGAIAGSTLTLDRAVRYAVQVAGVPLAVTLMAATAHPARTLGLTDRGVLRAGTRADLVTLDDDLQVTAVMRGGTWLRPPETREP